jgi:hypothetical protein
LFLVLGVEASGVVSVAMDESLPRGSGGIASGLRCDAVTTVDVIVSSDDAVF